MPAPRVAHPPHGAGEPVVRRRRRQQLDRHAAFRRPVRRGLVEGDSDARALAPGHDAGRGVIRRLALRHHAHDGSDAKLLPGQLATARAGVRHQGATREAGLLDRFDIREREPAPHPLREWDLREALRLRGALPVQQRTEPVEVLVEVHGL